MPSKKILAQKAKVVEVLSDDFKQAQSMVFAESRGLTVAQDTAMRAAMRKAGVKYQVVKNTISSRALSKIGVDGLEDVLKGPTAIAYSKNDVTAAAKVVKEYADKFDKFNIKGGILNGKLISTAEVQNLASIPSLDVLYGQVVFSLMAPISGLAMILNAIKEKGEEAGVTNVADIVGAQVAAKTEVAE
jgi:large subunit ribosomal protein L10